MNIFSKLMAVLRPKAHLPAVALLALMSGLTAKADVVIDATTFPDENFRNYILSDVIGARDGVLTDAEIAGVTNIGCTYRSIASLKGIEYFTALTSLYCWNNQLTSLDVSKNTALRSLSCSNNQLTSLDFSNNPALTSLFCNANQLTSLDVSKNTALKSLQCSDNQLMSLDVSNNTALQTLYCVNTQLTSLDVSNNTALTRLDCYNNKLTSLDVSKNTALEILYCYDNQLTELDLSNITALTIGALNYFNQTRTLAAESAVTPEGVRFYYLRLDNNVNGDKTIVERMTETNFGGEASKFDPSKVVEWTSGGAVSDGILLLTDVTEDPITNTASGTVKYRYNVNSSIDSDGMYGNFTLNWTAPMPEVPAPGPASLELKDKAMRLQLTRSRQLEVVTPDAGEITWTSSNPEVIEVDNTGRVTALKNGLAIITATAANGNSNWCAVWGNLLGDLNEDDKVDVADLNIGVSIVLGNESFTGKDFSNEKAIRLQLTQSRQLEVAAPTAGEITWTSSNPEAVEVDSTGRVTALKNGLAIITATTADGISNYAVWSYLPGDLNEDDKVDVADLNTEISIVLGN